MANALEMLVASGVVIVRACRLSLQASGLPVVQDDISRIVAGLLEGDVLLYSRSLVLFRELCNQAPSLSSASAGPILQHLVR